MTFEGYTQDLMLRRYNVNKNMLFAYLLGHPVKQDFVISYCRNTFISRTSVQLLQSFCVMIMKCEISMFKCVNDMKHRLNTFLSVNFYICNMGNQGQYKAAVDWGWNSLIFQFSLIIFIIILCDFSVTHKHHLKFAN